MNNEVSFKFINETPENLGISSKWIMDFIESLKKNGLFMHSVMLLRHGKIAAEGYYKPFDSKRKHRMYSVSKSFVSTAVGALCDEGRLSLDDKVYTFFEDLCPENLHPYIKNTTVRDLLMMASPFSDCSYLLTPGNDWVWSFFNTKPCRPSGTTFYYDTSGTYVLDAIVEKITGMNFLDYLYEKGMKYTGFSKDAWCVKAPDGYSWGGSGVICTPRDLARLALVYLGGGELGGHRIISEEYAKAATSKQIGNNDTGHTGYSHFGYGYQIWRTRDNSFSFVGMGGQFAICVPSLDLAFICTSDNQGNPSAYGALFEALWDNIIYKIKDEKLPADNAAYEGLLAKCASLELLKPEGDARSDFEKKVDGVTYKLCENPMGIEWVRLSWGDKMGILRYKNERGEKEIHFGHGEYRSGKFPETHYSGEKINTPKGEGYECLAAGVWTGKTQFGIKINIIDDYFGNLMMNFGFKGDEIGVTMHKTAEWFLDEYEGFAGGVRQDS